MLSKAAAERLIVAKPEAEGTPIGCCDERVGPTCRTRACADATQRDVKRSQSIANVPGANPTCCAEQLSRNVMSALGGVLGGGGGGGERRTIHLPE